MKKSIRCVAVWVPAILAILVLANPAMAKEYSLGEVVVSGEQASVAEKCATVREVTAADIEKSGARTLDEAIALLPGLHIRTANDGAPRIDVRGMRTRQVNLLLNGIPMNSTYDGQFDPSLVTVDSIARIKVTYGASSVLYGAGGSAAVINVITKGGDEDPTGSLSAKFGEGRSKQYAARFGAEQGIFGLNASASMYDRDYFPVSGDYDADDSQMQDDGSRRNSDRSQRNAVVNVTLKPQESSEVGLFVNMHQGSYGKPNVVHRDFYTSNNLSGVDRFKFERMENTEGFSAQLAASHEFEIPLNMRGWVFANQLDEQEEGYDDWNYSTQNNNRNAFESLTTTRRYGAGLQASYDLDNLGKVTTSLNAERQDWDNTYSTRPDHPASVTTDQEGHVSEYSAGLEYQVNPIDDLGLVAGVATHAQHRQDTGNETGETYMLGAYYDLFPQTRLRANWARKLRFPSISQLYDPGKGNLTLKPERTTHYELGIEQGIESLATEVSVSAFQTKTKDFIEKDNVTNINENHDEYTFKGVEAMVVNTWFTGLTLTGSYTFLESRNESEGSKFEELQYRPRTHFALTADYLFPQEWVQDLRAHASWMSVSKSYIFTKNGATRSTLCGFNVLDVKLTKGFMDNALKTYLGVNNLLDEYYEESYALPRPGRNIYAGVSYSF